ncbi:MAG: carbohydrate kinase family protein [Nitrospiraceae bacterium]|nr:carbohydrate kinase family protein [Nitrospiraceae bacterium]
MTRKDLKMKSRHYSNKEKRYSSKKNKTTKQFSSERTIYISGSIAYDKIMDFPGRFSDHILPDKIHILNVCFTVNGMIEKFGGTAGNIAYSLSLLGERPMILATIGKDYKNYFEWLKKNKIPATGIKIIREELTSAAYITTDKADNQITGFNPGSMKYPSKYRFKGVHPEHSIAILAPGNLDDMMQYAKVYKKKGIPYICDPGQSLTGWEKNNLIEWLDGSAMLITNDYELEMIMGKTCFDKKGLLNLTKIIVTTLGEKGSVITRDGVEEYIPAAKTSSVVDPTGAGDAYRAGILKGIVMGKDIITAAKMGAVAATYAIENYGTQEHKYTYRNFISKYNNNFGELK